jgi:hypothetical protein
VIGHYLNAAYRWRETLVIFAAINLAVCLPLNWFGLAHRDPPRRRPARSDRYRPTAPSFRGAPECSESCCSRLIMSLNAFLFGVISIQLVPLLEAAGLIGATAV